MVTMIERARQADTDRRVGRRRDVEYVLAMAAHFTHADRVLLEYLYRDGHSAVDYARLTRRSVRSVQRRVKALLQRIYSPEFRWLVVHGQTLPAPLRPVARRLILEGRALRETARLTGRSLHTVRQQRLELAVLLKTHASAKSTARAPLGSAESQFFSTS
ncbi:MAG: hypothetical protein AAGA25_07895 [Planctomycetota bacterium]